MSGKIVIDKEAILQQIKLSAKIPEVVEGILSREIMNNTANELCIEITVEELQEAADRFRLLNQLHDSQETFKWLEKHGLSVDEFEEIIHYNLTVLRVNEALFKEKIGSYFAEKQLDYLGAAIYEVILEDEDEAMEVFYELQAEETSFHDVAVQYIQDVELRRKGGYRGIVYRQDLKPEISAAVFAANPPQLIKPITTSSGIHLIRVEEIVKPQLDAALSSRIGLELFKEWLLQKMNEMEIEVAI